MFDPDAHHRQSIRLPGYDYSGKGHYYVTICVLEKQCLFGEVTDGRVLLSDLGKMIDATWLGLSAYHPGVQMDTYVVMPNHLHGIVVLSGEGRARRPAPTLGDVIKSFKSYTTKQSRMTRLWQRNYFEHIIRNEDELNHCRRYMAANPSRWS